jgi:hypothetical protein
MASDIETSFYTNIGTPWEKTEEEQLINEYTVKKYDILKICQIHKRLPGGIISRLRKIGVIEESSEARGYDEYKKSPLYKAKIERKKEIKCSKSEKTTDTSCATGTKDSSKVTKKMLREQRFREIVRSELDTLRSDIKEIKDNIKSLTDMLKAIYEFEEVDEA